MRYFKSLLPRLIHFTFLVAVARWTCASTLNLLRLYILNRPARLRLTDRLTNEQQCLMPHYEAGQRNTRLTSFDESRRVRDVSVNVLGYARIPAVQPALFLAADHNLSTQNHRYRTVLLFFSCHVYCLLTILSVIDDKHRYSPVLQIIKGHWQLCYSVGRDHWWFFLCFQWA